MFVFHQKSALTLSAPHAALNTLFELSLFARLCDSFSAFSLESRSEMRYIQV